MENINDKTSYSNRVNSLNDELIKRIEFLNDLEEIVEKLFEFNEQDIEIRIESVKCKFDNLIVQFNDKIIEFKIKIKKYQKLKRYLANKRFRQSRDKVKEMYTLDHMSRLKEFNFNKLLSKVEFNLNCKFQIQKHKIGRCVKPCFCNYNKIIKQKFYSIPSYWPAKIVWLPDKEKIVITDPFDATLKLLDAECNFIGENNPDSSLNKPGSICVNESNEIFVFDHCKKKVFVFNSDFKYLREFGDNRVGFTFEMIFDDETNLFYVTSYLSNLLTVWNGKTGDFVKELTINSPTFINVFENRLYLMSAIESELFAPKMAEFFDTDNTNCIYILDKYTLDILKTIEINNYLHPKGLEVDSYMNIWICAYEALAATSKESQKTKYLFKLDENANCLNKINIGIACFFSLTLMNNKILFSAPYKEKPLYMIEFE